MLCKMNAGKDFFPEGPEHLPVRSVNNKHWYPGEELVSRLQRLQPWDPGFQSVPLYTLLLWKPVWGKEGKGFLMPFPVLILTW